MIKIYVYSCPVMYVIFYCVSKRLLDGALVAFLSF